MSSTVEHYIPSCRLLVTQKSNRAQTRPKRSQTFDSSTTPLCSQSCGSTLQNIRIFLSLSFSQSLSGFSTYLALCMGFVG